MVTQVYAHELGSERKERAMFCCLNVSMFTQYHYCVLFTQGTFVRGR
jgi:hypothetical protein